MSAVAQRAREALREIKREQAGLGSECEDFLRELGRLALAAALREAFRGRLRADALQMGFGRDGKLTAAGRVLGKLEIESFDTEETRSAALVLLTARLGSLRFSWRFEADEQGATYSLTASNGFKPAALLVRMAMAHRDQLVEHTMHTSNTSRRDADLVCTHMRAVRAVGNELRRRGWPPEIPDEDLLDALIAYVPESYTPDWEVYERLSIASAAQPRGVMPPWFDAQTWWRRQIRKRGRGSRPPSRGVER